MRRIKIWGKAKEIAEEVLGKEVNFIEYHGIWKENRTGNMEEDLIAVEVNGVVMSFDDFDEMLRRIYKTKQYKWDYGFEKEF